MISSCNPLTNLDSDTDESVQSWKFNSSDSSSEDRGFESRCCTSYKSPVCKRKYKSNSAGIYTNKLLEKNRMKMNDVSVIQTITQRLKYPCVGLDKITEIQGLNNIHYYCEVCDEPCCFHLITTHIDSFNHRLECLKLFVPLIYEIYSKLRPCDAESKVNKIIKKLADTYGCGEIKVRKEYITDGDQHHSSRLETQKTSGYRDSSDEIEYLSSGSSRSIEVIGVHESEIDKKKHDSFNSLISLHKNSLTDCMSVKAVPGPSNLDITYNDKVQVDYQRARRYKRFSFDANEIVQISGFYCNVCNISMVSENNWNMHLIGQKHIKNTRKSQGKFPSRKKPNLVPDARPSLMDKLERLSEVVVGLDMVKETHDLDAPGPMYTCMLCLHNATSITIIDHILTLKHRIKFLEKIQHPILQTLKGVDKYNLHMIIKNVCAEIEAQQGRGALSVFLRH